MILRSKKHLARLELAHGLARILYQNSVNGDPGEQNLRRLSLTRHRFRISGVQQPAWSQSWPFLLWKRQQIPAERKHRCHRHADIRWPESMLSQVLSFNIGTDELQWSNTLTYTQDNIATARMTLSIIPLVRPCEYLLLNSIEYLFAHNKTNLQK